MVTTIVGDAATELAKLPEGHFHCCVTSPPYWGLRDYQIDGQIGQESTPQKFAAEIVRVMAQVHRVLHPSGTLWLNLGDSYAADMGGAPMPAQTVSGGEHGKGDDLAHRGMGNGSKPHRNAQEYGLKHKDLIGIPWRVAFAMQNWGWWLRSEIIWHKPVPMPESVEDRPTKSHEHIFMFSKQANYYYDYVGSLEPSVDGMSLRNPRDVWTIPFEPSTVKHFAPFPSEIPRRAIQAATSNYGCCNLCGTPYVRSVEVTRQAREKLDCGNMDSRGVTRTTAGLKNAARTERKSLGWRPGCRCFQDDLHYVVPCRVLDPFGGTGTTGAVAADMGRDATLIELNPDSVEIIENRISNQHISLLSLMEG